MEASFSRSGEAASHGSTAEVLEETPRPPQTCLLLAERPIHFGASGHRGTRFTSPREKQKLRFSRSNPNPARDFTDRSDRANPCFRRILCGQKGAPAGKPAISVEVFYMRQIVIVVENPVRFFRTLSGPDF